MYNFESFCKKFNQEWRKRSTTERRLLDNAKEIEVLRQLIQFSHGTEKRDNRSEFWKERRKTENKQQTET